MKKYLIIVCTLVLLVTSCGPLPEMESIMAQPRPDAPASDSGSEVSLPVTPGPEVHISPEPVPVPPLPVATQYALIVQAWGNYLTPIKDTIRSEEDLREEWRRFGEMSLQVGDRRSKIREIFEGFSENDWSQIREAGEELAKDGALTTAVIYLRGCKTTCASIFSALWWACAHLATGENWIKIPEGMMTNHPMPELCGRTFNWEYLVDILDTRCPGYSVEYRGSTIVIRKLVRYSDNRYELTWDDAQTLIVVGGVLTAATVVGIVVLSGGTAAPAFAVVLLVP
ncbi:MAG: hypothetical protein KatS3mg101_0779 [Patescibacteria group bacterium]|nr:MAG: hypothetical protein KatS3mg101_0779 [Patescibacteria group bacterium]